MHSSTSSSKPARNGKAIVSIFFVLLFLAVSETGLRLLDPGRGSGRTSYSADRVVVLNLGTSRTFRGLCPELIADIVEKAGRERPFVANVHKSGTTNVGLLEIYRETIQSWAARTTPPGIVAIETRCSAMNDGHVLKGEETWLDGTARERNVRVAWNKNAREAHKKRFGFFNALRAGRFDRASRFVLREVRFTRGYPYVKRIVARRRRAKRRHGGVMLLERYLETFSWGKEPYGWIPFNVAIADLHVDEYRDSYEGKMLKNYHVGGVQADALVELIRTVKRDGWTPVLYQMPVSEIHRTFYKEGVYESYINEIKRISEEEGVVAVDLDEEQDFRNSDFHDTHHLRERGALKASRRFAHRVLLPLLRDRP